MGSGFRTFTAGEVLTASNVQNYLQDQVVMVFGGSAARSSAIGTANFEEGMLTYLTDVDKLQVYTGAAFADVYPAAASTQGLTLINTTSFSGVASQSINNVFTSTYDNYKILINITSVSTQMDFQMRLRVSGTDDSSANYSRGGVYNYINGTPTALASVGDTKWAVGFINSGTGSKNNFSFDMYRPNFAGVTTATALGVWNNNVTFAGFFSGFMHEVSTSYDGFTLLCNTGTITGIVSVYGYND